MEEVIFRTIETHDILINDRGLLSHEMTNYLKTEYKVDTYFPARENMTLFQNFRQIRLIEIRGL